MKLTLSKADLRLIEEHGLNLEEIHRQVELLRGEKPVVSLKRPCTLGDGLHALRSDERDRNLELFSSARRKGGFTQFIPASGSASRMFKDFYAFLQSPEEGANESVNQFVDHLESFAFYSEISESTLGQGTASLIRFILEPQGLGYGQCPKAAILFHRYGEYPRTALEEHFILAQSLASDEQNRCRMHLTISSEHHDLLSQRVTQMKEKYDSYEYHVTLSDQASSTQTISLDQRGELFRSEDGDLLFRPGGHGSLLLNVTQINTDFAFIQNIDNIPVDEKKPALIKWKSYLGGHCVWLRKQCFDLLERLHSAPNEQNIQNAMAFLKEHFSQTVELDDSLPKLKKAEALIDFLNRPFRVCGMVRNEGEPGGGPFWIHGDQKTSPVQIVEQNQVNLDDPNQANILQASTHFNPVDLVCSLKSWDGNFFDLTLYSEPSMAMVTEKSNQGQKLKALEHPGLWNGGMARWNSCFVEVPLENFNPVKTVLDLLNPAHQVSETEA